MATTTVFWLVATWSSTGHATMASGVRCSAGNVAMADTTTRWSKLPVYWPV